MKAVIYARFSSDAQKEASIEGQIRECTEYAERKGFTLLGCYVDRALSAKTDNRPEFLKMIKDSGKRLFDAIIVWKLDRFSRNRYDSAHYKAILRKNGVKVISATEAISEDSTGILLESLLEGYAEFYSAELSEKVIRGMTENALKCKYNGGGIPIGYKIDDDLHFQIDPLAAPMVQEAFKLYADGSTIQEVTDILNQKGLRTVHNKAMSINSVTRMLQNRRYIGEYKHREIVNPNGVPVIIEQELFDMVQERMTKNKKAPARFKAVEERYLLTTKLFCGLCGAYMVGESGTSHKNIVHHYYKCATAKRKKTCKKKSVKKQWIEDLVVNETIKMLFTDGVIHQITEMVLELQTKENVALPMLQKQLAEVDKGIENMLDAIQKGVLTESTKKRLEALETRKSALEVSILQEQIQKPLMSREQVIFWLHKFRDIDVTDFEQRQRLIDGFVNAVYLYDDKVVLTYNYKDGSKTISLCDLNGSDIAPGGGP